LKKQQGTGMNCKFADGPNIAYRLYKCMDFWAIPRWQRFTYALSKGNYIPWHFPRKPFSK